ncbi:hypothetical protein TNCV_4583561 [Trichonephila clavipes]|nr:hypothetical protein TNCV_4583561 [Trichonephila clavipes]
MTNQHRTWGRKPRLVGENRDNCSHWEDDEPNEGCGQTNADIQSAVEGMKELTGMRGNWQISHSSGENKSGDHVVICSRCIKLGC